MKSLNQTPKETTEEELFEFERPYPIVCPSDATVEEFLAMRMVISGQMFGDTELPKA